MHTIPTFQSITSVENLLAAWQEFVRGKRTKPDVNAFSMQLMNNIFALHRDLRENRYRHGDYYAFAISDPKPRSIHKASVRDRLLHHAIHRVLYPFFARKFISDSFSCQTNKGTHRALNRFQRFGYKVSRNRTRTCWVLKCDIRKFFASIDQTILRAILTKHIEDERLLALLAEVIGSFSSGLPGKGLPLGNLTSQLLVNVYMNEFDQFVKHRLKAHFYIRYADDFVILSEDRQQLERFVPQIATFLNDRLALTLHPQKTFIQTLASGVDFLGWVHFPDHRVLRTTTKRRMLGKVNEKNRSSYLGMLKHGNGYELEQIIEQKLKEQEN